MRTRSLAVFLLVGVLWGSEWLVTRDLDVPPLGALALRYAIAAVVLGAIVLVRRLPPPTLRLVVISAIAGISFAAAPVLLIDWASNRVSPGLVVVILAMTPLLAALIEGRASGGLLLAQVGGVGGTALLSSQGLSFAGAQWAGVAAVLAAGALIAGSVICVKRQLGDVPVVTFAAIQLASGAVFLAMMSWIVEGRGAFVWSWNLAGIEGALAITGSALALPLYYWILRRMESFQVTSSQWVVTVVGVGEGLLMVRVTPGWRVLGGVAILLVSLGVLLRTRPDEELPLTIAITLQLPKS